MLPISHVLGLCHHCKWHSCGSQSRAAFLSKATKSSRAGMQHWAAGDHRPTSCPPFHHKRCSTRSSLPLVKPQQGTCRRAFCSVWVKHEAAAQVTPDRKQSSPSHDVLHYHRPLNHSQASPPPLTFLPLLHFILVLSLAQLHVKYLLAPSHTGSNLTVPPRSSPTHPSWKIALPHHNSSI